MDAELPRGPATRLQRLELLRERTLRRAVGELDVFARLCWELLEGRPLVWGWYHSLICRELEAVSRGDVKNLVICVPPRCTKSFLVAVFFPAWHWLRRPEEGFLSVSNDDRVSGRDALRSRHILLSPVYEELQDIAHRHFDVPRWTLDASQQVKVNYRNTRGGERQALSVTTRTTGKGCDIQLLDDLVDARTLAQSSPDRQTEICEDAWQTVTEFLGSRFNDRAQGRRVMIGQRLTQHDPPGMAIAAGWKPIVLPMHGDPDRPHRHPEDKRARGELLDPKRFPPQVLATLEEELGPQAPAQLEQDPTPAKGGLLDADWLSQHYPDDPADLAATCDEVVISADAAKKPTGTSDYHAIQVWGRRGARKYLLDRCTERMGYPEFERAMDTMIATWAPRAPGRVVALVEDTANGTTYLQVRASRWLWVGQATPDGPWLPLSLGPRQEVAHPMLSEREGPRIPLIPFHPSRDTPGDDKSKPARFLYFTRAAEGHEVFTPDPARYPWVRAWVAAVVGFPRAAHDDDADATSQCFLRWAVYGQRGDLDAFTSWLGGAG
jgi:phage terminase large subunit-like protein